jgi:hypothetical protein
MKEWMRRIRGAIIVGLTWAIGWGVIGGGLMELLIDPHGRIADIWPAVLGIPGFFGGVLFSIVLAAAERHRRFDELSLPRFGALGAVAGALLGGVGVALLGLGPAILIPTTVLGALSASGSLALARRADSRELLRTGENQKTIDR